MQRMATPAPPIRRCVLLLPHTVIASSHRSALIPPPAMLFSALLTLGVLLLALVDVSVLATPPHRHSLPPSTPLAPNARPAPSGDIFVHDSSGVVYDNSSRLYYTFASGMGRDELIAVRVSTDGYAWTRGPSFLTTMPDWVRLKVPNTETGWWAPDIAFFNGWWHLSYAISSGGSQHSCIGLAVNQRLDDKDPLFKWIDAGPITSASYTLPSPPPPPSPHPLLGCAHLPLHSLLSPVCPPALRRSCSTPSLPYNCIDMHLFENPSDGTYWMNWGSYWGGLFVQQLEGFPIVSIPVGQPTNIARHDVENHPIEASWIQPHPSYITAGTTDFWFFVDWEYCCQSLNSTYDIRVGRSTTGPAGPYLDRDGVDMVKGGGTEFLGTEVGGRQIGPGQIGFPWGGPAGTGGPQSNATAPVVSFFYYDRSNKGQFTLGQAVVTWVGEGKDAWPVVSERL